MFRCGAAAAVLLVSLALAGTASAVTDADILNFALNLEYLEGEFYSCATTGKGLPASLRGGGPASVGCQKATLTGDVANIANEIAKDEYDHVVFLRTALGSAAVPIPLLNIGTGANGSFSIAADAAVGKTLSPPFSPYANNLFFLHGAFIFEDVGVTAYQGAASLISNKAYLTAAAGILAVEAYHAGSIREQLIQNATVVTPYGVTVNTIVGAISALRAKLSGMNDDQGISLNGAPNLTPTDANAITFPRTVNQVLNIVTAGGADGMGLFYPNGLNGAINGSSASAAYLAGPLAGRRRSRSLMATSITDVDILNFALNLEYLEAEFYSWATKGYGIPIQYRGGGAPSTGASKAKLSAPILALAKEIAQDELNHVIFLRTALGAAAIPKPAFNLGTAFSTAANAALGTTLNPAFSPYSSDITFLHGAFIFEDVGVTAYKGAAALINNTAYITPAAGILAVEAYHAGAIRTLLFQQANMTVQPYGAKVSAIVGAISALRAKASGAADDQNVIDTKTYASNIVPADMNSIAFSRTPAQVDAVVTLGAASGKGGFFPQGLTGTINGTAGSVGAVNSAPGGSAGAPSTAPSSSSSGSPAASPAGSPTSSATSPSGSSSSAPAPAPSSAFTSAIPSAAALLVGIVSTLAMLL